MKTRARKAMKYAVAATAAVVLAACGGSGFDDDDDGGDEPTAEPTELSGNLTAMIGSSGEAETTAVQAAAKRFADETGVDVEVIPAQDLVQQLQQGFAGGNPPDLFYVSPDRFRIWVDGDSLYPYGDQVDDADDFYESLREAFTLDGQLYCLPKDGSASALVIDTDAWEEAGLTEDDYPTTWDELTDVARKLTTDDRAGLGITAEYNTAGTFMLAGGGFYVNEDQTEVTADTPENAATLHYLLDNIEEGIFATSQQLAAEWEGQAFGEGKAAMVVTGGWIAGTLETDYPDRNWTAIEMPEGPGGQGSGAFTNCWGVAQQSDNRAAAVALARHFTSAEEQKTFTETYGSPAYSRRSLEGWVADQVGDDLMAFQRGLDYGRTQVAIPGFDSVLNDFTAQIEAMIKGDVTPEDALARLQKNGEDVLADQ